ncbi:MAG TPA: response regulator [Bryobacteraceae bacterium]|nr:response regulator [Bryobacteraceae bacterium]
MTDSARGCVLLVEDDDQVRSMIRMFLTSSGYSVLEARTGQEGLDVAENEANRIDLLLSDMLLPELSGFDLAQKVLERSPQMKVLFMTGYVEGDIVQRCISELGASFLDKPFQNNVLLSRVQEAIARPKNEVA